MRRVLVNRFAARHTAELPAAAPPTIIAAVLIFDIRFILSAGEAQPQTLGGQNVPPFANQLAIRLPDRTNVAVKIVQAQRIHAAVVLAQRRVPVHLVHQAVPGEAQQRDAVLLEPVRVGPLLPAPPENPASSFPCASQGVRNERSTGG